MDNEELDIKLKATLVESITEFNKLDKTATAFGNTIVKINRQLDSFGNLSKITQTITDIDNKGNKIKNTFSNSGELISTSITKSTKNADNLKSVLSTTFNVNKLYLYWNLTKRLRSTISGLVTSAIDYKETENKFNVSMGSARQEATRFVNKMSEAVGIAKAELMDYQATFKNILSGLGSLTDKQSETISESLSKMALDYSSLYNVKQADAMEKFQSALVGSIRPIRSDSGYDVSEATLSNKLNELGIERSVSKLNQMEKRILRIIVLMDQMRRTGAMNDLARTIEEPANQLRVLKAQIQETGVWLGNVFMGTLGNVLPYINAFVMVIKELIKMLAIFTGYVGDDTNLSDVFESVEDSTSGISSNLGNASKKAKELKKTLMSFDVLNVINTPTESKGSSGGGEVGTIDPKILGALKDYDSIMENVRMKATDIRDKIMDWLGYTKIIDPLTGEVSWKLREGYQNIEKIRDLLLAIGGTILAVKIYKAIKLIGNALSALKATGAVVWFKNLFASISGVAKGSTAAKSALTFLITPILKVISVIGGVVLAFKGAKTITAEYNKLLEGQAGNQWNVAKGMVEMAAGGALVGAAFGGPVGAAIGGVTGALAGLIVNLVESKKVLHEIAESKLYGTLSISTESWKKELEKLIQVNFGNVVDNWQKQISSLSEEFEIASAKVEGYGIRFGILGEKISNEDISKIKTAVNDMCTSTTNMIDENTSAQITMWSNTYKTLGNVSKEEQKNWLQVIQTYGKNQKQELKSAQDNVTKTYEKAIKTRGYLTDEEYEYIKKQLEKIRKLTQQNMTQSNSDLLYLKNKFVADSSKLDEESYKNYNEAAENFRKEKLDAISKEYNTQLNMLNQMYSDGQISLEQFNKKVFEANEARSKNEQEVDSKLKSYKQEIFDSLMTKYNELVNKTDESSKEQVKILNQLFKDVDIDPSNFVTQMQKAGRKGNEQLLKYARENKLNLSDLVGNNTDWSRKGQTASTAFWKNFQSGKVSISTNNDGGAQIKVRGAGKYVSAWASGGFPDIGEIFMAREAGPELVGRIGNRNSVVNNDQIVQSVSQGVAQAVAQVLVNRQTGGQFNFYLDSDEIMARVEEKINRNANIYGMA